MTAEGGAALERLSEELAGVGCALRLGWHRRRYLNLADNGSGPVLHVLPGLASDPALRKPLIEFVKRGGRPPRRLGGLIRRRAPVAFEEPCPGPEIRDLMACDTRRAFVLCLARELAADGAWLRCNDNRSTLVSLRQDGFGIYAVSVHHRLFDHPRALPGIHGMLLGTGTAADELDRAIQLVFEDATNERLKVAGGPPELPGIGVGFDFRSCMRGLARTYFPGMRTPQLTWMRDPGRRALRSIHFGTYHRRPRATISLHPRLRRPWMAQIFVESVIHHELCHHRLAATEGRRDRPHGEHFRDLERGYPYLEVAKEWQRFNLDRILSG